ncbi:transposase, partial [archaeon]|nr:transposase [archaeon]
TKTNIVTAAEITEGYSSDTQYLPQLVNATEIHFNIKEVSAGKAYSSKNNVETIVEAGVTPYIPFKKNMVASGPTVNYLRKTG